MINKLNIANKTYFIKEVHNLNRNIITGDDVELDGAAVPEFTLKKVIEGKTVKVKIPVILLRSNQSFCKKVYVLVHEIAHALLHESGLHHHEEEEAVRLGNILYYLLGNVCMDELRFAEKNALSKNVYRSVTAELITEPILKAMNLYSNETIDSMLYKMKDNLYNLILNNNLKVVKDNFIKHNDPSYNYIPKLFSNVIDRKIIKHN